MNRGAVMWAAAFGMMSVLAGAGSAAYGAGPERSVAAAVAKLPELTGEAARPVRTDWLVAPTTRKAGVYRTSHPNEIVLDNGLIRRTFRVAPNGATVGFDNLMTRQAIIRGVKPEAVVTLDGVRCDVGGLIGQSNYAYLLPEWLDQLKADPKAFQLTGLETGKTKKRFEWKRTRRSADLPWPPPGVSLTLNFKPSSGLAEELAAQQSSGAGRKVLVSDDFEKLSEQWKVHRADIKGATFTTKGKVGLISTTPNSTVYAERKLPPGVNLLQCSVDCGTDDSNSWGPGLTVVWPSRVLKFYIRPNQKSFGIWDGTTTQMIGKVDTSKIHHLRVRIERGTASCEASLDDKLWNLVHKVTVGAAAGHPTTVRVGKTSQEGGDASYGDIVPFGQCRVGAFRAYGPIPQQAKALQAKQRSLLNGLVVSVHYELYDGVPVISKWITVRNGMEKQITVDRFASEVLAVVEHSNWVEVLKGVPMRHPDVLHVETDFSFGGFNHPNTNHHVVHWRGDPQYRTQVNYACQEPCLLVVEPTHGPAQDVPPGKTFESCRAFELVYDATDRERRGLALRRMYRTIAPWVTENPLMMHARFADWNRVKLAIDQCAEVGFEMVILTFGSGFNIENNSPAYIAAMKKYADYAKSKGVQIGGYSLLASRRVGGGNDVVSPPGTRPLYGNCPALTSTWGQAYFRKLYQFYAKTGFSLLEHDGSYPGDLDVTPRPPLQKGLADSRWAQYKVIATFYRWCRAHGVYLNVPDYYYLNGSSKCGMGYREVNWSLPRAQQVIHTRQNIYDGTWEKTPGMGWMFVPLTQYHGGGAAATIEPLDKHRDHYERMLYSNLAMGVQACYRGPRLYDTDRTKALVKQWVAWFRKYRDILESDIIHGRRADGRDLDWVLHANPRLKHKGMLVVFNPLKKSVEKTIRVNLYYTGLKDAAKMRERQGEWKTVKLDRRFNVDLPVKIEAQGMSWFAIEAP